MLSHCTRHYFDLHALISLVHHKLIGQQFTVHTHTHTQLTFINKVQQGDREAVLHDKNVYVRSCNKTQTE